MKEDKVIKVKVRRIDIIKRNTNSEFFRYVLGNRWEKRIKLQQGDTIEIRIKRRQK